MGEAPPGSTTPVTNPRSLYGATITVAGRITSIQPRVALCEEDVLRHLPGLAAAEAGGAPVAVVHDARTKAAAGHAVLACLRAAGINAREVLVHDPAPGHSPACDESTMQPVASRCEGAGLLLAVGSGVINDLAKWAAFTLGKPCACVATAASMNGYTSANVAATVRGVKTLVHAAAPRFVLADPAVLAAAPWRLTASGLGDIIAKSVSSADWWLNYRLFGDEFIPECVDLIADIEPLYLDHPEELRAGDRGALVALFDGLLLTGVAMTMAGSSTPASGGEHLVSHALDMMESLDGEAHDLHGRQVGVGTILASALYERVLALDGYSPVLPPDGIDDAFWGALAPEVRAQHDQKRGRMAEFHRLAIESPGEPRAILKECARFLRPAAAIKDCLARAGAAHRAEDLGMARERVLAALLHGREMRARFTILDVAWILGVMPAAGEGLVAEWA